MQTLTIHMVDDFNGYKYETVLTYFEFVGHRYSETFRIDEHGNIETWGQYFVRSFGITGAEFKKIMDKREAECKLQRKTRSTLLKA